MRIHQRTASVSKSLQSWWFISPEQGLPGGSQSHDRGRKGKGQEKQFMWLTSDSQVALDDATEPISLHSDSLAVRQAWHVPALVPGMEASESVGPSKQVFFILHQPSLGQIPPSSISKGGSQPFGNSLYFVLLCATRGREVHTYNTGVQIILHKFLQASQAVCTS